MAGPWITEHEIKVVEDCMRNGWYNYEYVERFQKEFAVYHDRRFALMTPNCTHAIHLLLTGLGIKPGDEVIMPEMTWIASGAGITYVGATPVFCDIDPVHWCMDPDALERSITPRTKAIIVVDIYGNMPNWDRLSEIAARHGIPIVDDSAEALGSTYKGVRAGKFGIGSVFSFHRTKTVATGEGGMLLLDDEKLYERCKFLRDHGRKDDGPAYFNYEVTYKYMPFNLQAAMGYAQFQRLDELVAKKRWIFEGYKERLADIEDIAFNPEPEQGFNSVWITGLLLGKSHRMTKLEFIAAMKKLDAPARPFFYPLSSLPAYPGQEAVYKPRNPVAYEVCSRGVNLPGALILEEKHIDFVSEAVRKVLRK